MNRSFRHRLGARSDKGSRQENEDSHVVRENDDVWAVADGMGGYENGKWASQTVIDAISAAGLTGRLETDCAILADAILAANTAIHEAGARSDRTMGSTAVILASRDDRFVCLWVGDSRAYLLRGEHFVQLTRDHTQVQDMVEHGMLDAAAARAHPLSNVLSRAIGVQAELSIDAVQDQIAAGDVFLLCSDGLTGVAADAEIALRLSTLQPEAAAQDLVDLALDRGAPDNVTVIVVACDEVTRAPEPAGARS